MMSPIFSVAVIYNEDGDSIPPLPLNCLKARVEWNATKQLLYAEKERAKRVAVTIKILARVLSILRILVGSLLYCLITHNLRPSSLNLLFNV